jgi:hypothetical protein
MVDMILSDYKIDDVVEMQCAEKSIWVLKRIQKGKIAQHLGTYFHVGQDSGLLIWKESSSSSSCRLTSVVHGFIAAAE